MAEGFVRIAVDNMANAIKQISIARGHDVTRYTLQCFGGAGGQHACLVADALGIGTGDDPPAGRRAQRLRHGARRPGRAAAAQRRRRGAGDGAGRARGGGGRGAARRRGWRRPRSAAARRCATRAATPASKSPVGGRHARGFRGRAPARASASPRRRRRWWSRPRSSKRSEEASPGRRGEGDRSPEQRWRGALGAQERPSTTLRTVPLPCSGEDLYRPRHPLRRATSSPAPPSSSIPPPPPSSSPAGRPRWTRIGNLILTRAVPREPRRAIGTEADPVHARGHVNNLFMAIAEEMGVALQNTASSVNIKERLDFSCALFDRDGRADRQRAAHPGPSRLDGRFDPHRSSRRAARRARAGRARDEARRRLCAERALSRRHPSARHHRDHAGLRRTDDAAPAWYVAARGHHADIGGIAPGSMPPDSRTIARRRRADRQCAARRRRAASSRRRCAPCSPPGDWPARNPDRNIADLKAQVAACARGADELRRVAGEYGRDDDRRLYGARQANAEEAVRRLIGRLSGRQLHATRWTMAPMVCGRDPGRPRGARSAIVDFTGTSAQQPNNFNAPYSICRAATLYVFRTMVDDAIPLNDGCLRPITLERARRLDAQPALSRPRSSPAMSRPAR